MKRYIRASRYDDDERARRRIIRRIADGVLRDHGVNNSIGTYDKFMLRMISRWADADGHDREFLYAVINQAFEKEFMK